MHQEKNDDVIELNLVSVSDLETRTEYQSKRMNVEKKLNNEKIFLMV